MWSNFASKAIILSVALVWTVYSISLVIQDRPSQTASGPVKISRVDVGQFLESMNEKDILLVDTRVEALYRTHHLEGAVNCTLPEIKKGYPNATAVFESSKGRDVYLYCSSDGCGTSAEVAEFMQYWPVKSVSVIDGGLSALLVALSTAKN